MTAAGITAIGTIIGSLISGIVTLLVATKQYNKSMALIEYRLGQLEKKVDEHNNLVERMYKVEAQLNGGNK